MEPIDILRIRRKLGLKQAELAKVLGYEDTQISRFERGQRVIRPVLAFALMYLEEHPEEAAK